MNSDASRRKGSASLAEQALPPPEPELTPATLVARAAALRERLRAEQDQSEARGCHSPELQQEFIDAGFYRALQPKRFGGYEFAYPDFYKAMVEIARGDPGVAWCLTLGASHNALVAAHWPEQAQVELFSPDGHFIAPHRAAGPAGTCKRVDGGYVIDGTWNYCSGIPYATHFIGNVVVSDSGDPPEQVVFAVPRDSITVLGDWAATPRLACAPAAPTASL